VVIPHIACEHLHFAAKSAESGTVQDAVPVALKRSAIFVLRFDEVASLRLRRKHRVGSEQKTLATLPRK